MLSESITYLKDSDDVWKTSIIGGLLVLCSFLLLPAILVWGYVVRVLARTGRGDDAAPAFEDWGELTVDGAKATAIVLAYALAPIVIGGLLFGSIWLATGGTPGVLGGVALALAGLLTLAAFAGAAYVAPAALAHFATDGERRLGSGLEFDALWPSLRTATYAVGWLLALGIVLVGALVAGALNEIPFVGVVLGAMVTFYALVAAYYVVGQTWEDLHPVSLDETREEPSAERPAV